MTIYFSTNTFNFIASTLKKSEVKINTFLSFITFLIVRSFIYALQFFFLTNFFKIYNFYECGCFCFVCQLEAIKLPK